MPHQKLTSSIRSEIIRNFDAKFGVKISKAKDALEPFAGVLFDLLVPMEQQALAATLGPGWTSQTSEIAFLAKTPTHTSRVRVKLGRYRQAPSDLAMTIYNNSYQDKYTVDAESPKLPEDVQDVFRNIFSLEKSYLELREELRHVMESCKSTKELARVWPSYIDYVSEERREQIQRGAKPRGSSKPEPAATPTPTPASGPTALSDKGLANLTKLNLFT